MTHRIIASGAGSAIIFIRDVRCVCVCFFFCWNKFQVENRIKSINSKDKVITIHTRPCFTSFVSVFVSITIFRHMKSHTEYTDIYLVDDYHDYHSQLRDSYTQIKANRFHVRIMQTTHSLARCEFMMNLVRAPAICNFPLLLLIVRWIA